MLAVRWLTAITTLLVLVQAAMIGQALYLGEMSLLALHGWLGSGSFLLAILLTGAAFWRCNVESCRGASSFMGSSWFC